MILRADQLAFGYPGGRTVLGGLDAVFLPCKLTAVLGPNGCGKSTLLRLCLGVLSPTGGSVQLDGIDVRRIARDRLSRHIAFVPQRDHLAFAFTVAESVGFGLLRHGPDDRDKYVLASMHELGLSALATRPVWELSQGQRQRVLLARAVAQLAPLGIGDGVVLADEPAAALDPRFALETMRCLTRQASLGRVVVAVMHDLAAAATFADLVLLLDASGTIIGHGPPATVLTRQNLCTAFDALPEAFPSLTLG